MKIVASRLSEGNKIFPAEIHVEETGITIKIPGLFSGETKHFDFIHIASVDVNSPIVGYSTITLFAGGTRMSAHGFSKSDAKLVKEAILDGKRGYSATLSNDNKMQSSNNTIASATSDTSKGERKEGFGYFIGKSINDLINQDTSRDVPPPSFKDLLGISELEAKIKETVDIKFSSDKDELLEQLNYLSSLASSKPNRKLMNVIIEKMDFGIMKLRSSGATEEANYFSAKLEVLNNVNNKKGFF